MSRLLKLVLLSGFMGAAAFSQAEVQCRTIGLVSDNIRLPEKYLLLRLALNNALQDGHFTFVSEPERALAADVVVRVHPDYSQAPFHLAVRVSRSDVASPLDLISEEITEQTKQSITGQIARAILTLCPSPRFHTAIVTSRRATSSGLTTSDEVPAEEACNLQRIEDISLFSTTQSLDEQQLSLAIAKDPLARKLGLRAGLPPGTGVQVTINQELGSASWSVVVAMPNQALCTHSSFILRHHDVTRRLAHDITLIVAESRGQVPPSLNPRPSSQTFKVQARSGIPQTAEDTQLYIRFEQQEIVVSKFDSTEVKRIPADSLLDVSVMDISQPTDSNWEDLAGGAADPVSAMMVGGYIALSGGIALIKEAFDSEHTLDLAWKDGSKVARVSFKIRGRDQRRLRTAFEKILEVARLKSMQGTRVQ